jgi:hypothetical protein
MSAYCNSQVAPVESDRFRHGHPADGVACVAVVDRGRARCQPPSPERALQTSPRRKRDGGWAAFSASRLRFIPGERFDHSGLSGKRGFCSMNMVVRQPILGLLVSARIRFPLIRRQGLIGSRGSRFMAWVLVTRHISFGRIDLAVGAMRSWQVARRGPRMSLGGARSVNAGLSCRSIGGHAEREAKAYHRARAAVVGGLGAGPAYETGDG